MLIDESDTIAGCDAQVAGCSECGNVTEEPEMEDEESFTLSDAEARRIRRGAFLPLFLILPLATMFGIDSSKSQPMHFILTFSIAIVFAAIVVSISRAGAKRRVADFTKTTLTVSAGKLIWKSTLGRSELSLEDVAHIVVRQKRDSVRSITLVRADGNRTTLEGYANMNLLLEKLQQNGNARIDRIRVWLNV